jgi:hypothetical protein
LATLGNPRCKNSCRADHTNAMIALLTQITQRLTEIENAEASEHTDISK